MHECRPSRGRVAIGRCGAFLGIAVCFLGTSLSRAQDVAEAARQEQARKAAAKNTSRHVYTEEDLKKDKILTPDDQAKVAARKPQQEPVPPAQANAQKQDPVGQESQTESLGEIARRYRLEKADRQAEEASKKKYAPFEYELAHPMVASPKADLVPFPSIRSNQTSINLPSLVPGPAEPHAFPKMSGTGKGRISPFQPRPSAAPGTLHLNPATAPPAVGAPARRTPATPRIFEGPTRPGVRSIRVQAGDSWWKLATRYLGSGRRWTELRELNPETGDSAERLRAGITLRIPEEERAPAGSLPMNRLKLVRVKPGDSLWSLAHDHLGRGNAWTSLACLNPGIQDYQRLQVGALVRLPGPNESAVCARVGDEGLKN